MSIRVEGHAIALALHNQNDFRVREYHLSPLSELELSAQLLKKALQPHAAFESAKSISCSFNFTGNTLIPKAIYQESFHPDYLKFNSQTEGTGAPQADVIQLTEALNVYDLPESSQAVSALFPKCRFFHESTIESELSLRLCKLSGQDGVFLFFSSGFFRIHVIQQGEFVLANTFEYASEMDVAYYVLYVFDQLGIKAANIQTFTTGNIESQGSEINLLREYIGPVKLLNSCALADLAVPEKRTGDARNLFTLFHQVLCV